MYSYTINFDASRITAQTLELIELLKSRFSEHIDNGGFGNISCLLLECLDVVVVDSVTTASADGANELTQLLGFGAGFELLTTALRAGEIESVGHLESFIKGLKNQEQSQ